MDIEVVIKLWKFFMMLSDKLFVLLKIVYFGWDLGLFDDFRKSFVYEYLGFFWVVGSKDFFDVEGLKLEFVGWSFWLVVIEDEKKV